MATPGAGATHLDHDLRWRWRVRERAALPAAVDQRRLLMVGVFALAISVRFWGLWWGAPVRVDMHPDERTHVIAHAEVVMSKVSDVLNGRAPLSLDTFDPAFLNYPSFLAYMTAAAAGVLQETGIIAGEDWQVHLIGRAIVASFGAATSIVVFLLALELGAPMAGAFLASLLMAMLPLHVWESHVAVTDVVMTFWIAVTLWASVRLVRCGDPRDYVMAGIALGLAVGSKYTGALAASAVLAGGLASRRPLRHTVRGMALAALVAVAACFVVTPYSFLRFPDFLEAMEYEARHTTSQHLGFSLPADGPQYRRYLYQLAAAWPFSLGFVLYAAALAGTAWAAVRLDRRRFVLLVFAAVYFGVTGRWTFTPLRYYLPLLVVGVLFAGVWLSDWLREGPAVRRAVAWGATLATLIYTAVFTFQTTQRFTQETRLEAGVWIQRNVPAGSRLLLCGMRAYLALPLAVNQYDLDYCVDDVPMTAGWRGYDVVQISSLVYNRAYRHGLEERTRHYDRLRNPDGRLRLIRRFESRFIHKRLYVRLDPMFEGYFLSPTIELYARKPAPGPTS